MSLKRVELEYASPATPDGPEAVPEGLGQRTARGFAWLMVQTLGSKVVSTVGQIVLVWLIANARDAFGVVALAYTTISFAGLLQQNGLLNILIQRQAHFRRWANPAFWMSLTAGVLSAGAMVAAAPLSGQGFSNPQVMWVILILAAAAPFDSLCMVPLARLQSQLRFRETSLVGLAANTTSMGASLLLAWQGFGVYSLVLPRPVVSLTQAVVLFALARPPIRLRPDFRRWRFLMKDTLLLLATAAFSAVLSNGDYLTLGWITRGTPGKELLGTYYLAFTLSTQMLHLFAGNLTNTLLPALSSIQGDLRRQTAAGIRAARLIAVVAIPMCLLQAALAEPLIALFFQNRLGPGVAIRELVEVFQVLSVGMALVALGGVSVGIMQAQGRFGFLFRWTMTVALFFMLHVIVGAMLGLGSRWPGPALCVAIAVAIFYAIFGPLGMYVAIRPGGGTTRDLAGIFVFPLLAGAGTIGAAEAVARMVPQVVEMRVAHLVLVAGMAGGLYLLAMRLWRREALTELRTRFAAILRRRQNGPAAA